MPKYIMGKDFYKHVGKKILMPHPADIRAMPIELKIKGVKNKQVTLEWEEMGILKTDNYSDDKNKYLIIQ